MKKKIMILTVIIAVIGGVLYLVNSQDKKADGDVYMASGNVEVTEVDAGFKIQGRLTELNAEEGQKVSKGDWLAKIDDRDMRSQVDQGRAFLNEGIARMEEMKAGARPQEVAQSRANVLFFEAELDKARKDYERAEILFKNGAISSQQMDAAKKGYEMALSQHKKSIENLSLVEEGPRKEEITVAENRVLQARASLSVLEERLKDAVIYAPVTGTILSRNHEIGEVVSPALPVYTIGDLEKPWIKVYVKEDRLGLIKLGQKAEIRVDSYPGKVYEGKVSFISSEAEFTPKNVQTQEERVKLVFGVKISVSNIHDELKPGMPADVRILLR